MKVIVFLIALLLSTNLEARPIISGISTNKIDIDTNFIGTQVLLFGAKGDSGDIFIVVRGPKQNYYINKKDQFLGIWYNKQRMKIKDAYSYYSFFSTANNFKINDQLFKELGIGKNSLRFEIGGNYSDVLKNIFQTEFIAKKEEKGLYTSNPHEIKFLDETLFKVAIDFPKNISSGVYTVEIYLIDEAHLAALQSIPIYVNQVGFSSKIHNMAYDHPFFYGILAIFIAVGAGWLANVIFARFFGR